MGDERASDSDVPSEGAIPYARLSVAGIGASAGGIRALQEFFASLPPHLGVALVVVVHLDPNHTSELASILAKSTSMRVVQVDRRLQLEADTVYVIPPNRRLLISNDSIDTAAFDEPRGQRAPIDQFFRSLAEQHGDGFAILLSGGGSDGALGVRAVRERGGLILVQDPDEAEHGSMPRSAIASGADFVLPVRQLAKQFVELIRTKAHVNARSIEPGSEDLVRQILGLLRLKTGQDFSRYKRPTVMRRLARRMQVTQTDNLERYLALVREHGEEAQALFNDLLISVTSFFRDPDAYKVLAAQVIPALFENRDNDSPVRVWIVGCATGEEAYSIAMLLLEEAARREVRPDLQIFATDLDGKALATAREGRYPAAIAADVSDERLRRFFVRDGDQYRIRRDVRDLIVFAVHSVLRDPPFSRMDLISCRNLMIYLDRDVQQQVCSTFQYALRPEGYLFLGSSETADNPPDLFTTLDREARIYQAVGRDPDRLPLLPRMLSPVRLPELTGSPKSGRAPGVIHAALHRQILEDIAPPAMLVDDHHAVVNLSETAGRFLLLPSGPMTSDAAEIVRPELRLELRGALHRAFEQNLASVSLPIPVQFNGTANAVVLLVRPISKDDATRTALVMFLEGGPIEAAPPDVAQRGEPSAVVGQLREELSTARRLQRTTRDQYDGATEELRAANEELQSINEEYRSTAEELETSKEELQSINEELQTLNHELKLKLDMVSRAHNDLQNLISATDVGTMFLDTSLRIQRFTPRVADLFNIVAGDEGRPVTDFTHRLDYQDMVADARRVLADLVPIERNVRTNAGRWFLARLRPYRTFEDKIDGVVITFVDVTERTEAEAAWEQRQRMLLDELSHRVKNTLAVVLAVTRQSLRGKVDDDVWNALELRLEALAKAHDLLVSNEWRGASLEALARHQLAAYQDRLSLSGPAVILQPGIATPLGLMLHELATNAAKYGALSLPGGQVRLNWETRDLEGGVRVLELTWTERGGPPVKQPKSLGASLLMDHAIADARVTRDFKPEGLVCAVSVPLSAAVPNPAV